MSHKTSKKRVSAKIRVLKSEGVPQEQAVATALNMERKHRLTAGGHYKMAKDAPEVIRA